ncbi:MAG: transglycosylase SLT domain-containing protein [Desulfobacteraceae bacterium]|nr:transglycosylase SLT domain-containing protein [Desulfobacteraceae bacterium]
MKPPNLRRSALVAGAAVWLLFFSVPAALAEGPETAAFPSLISALRIEGPMDFCGESVPLEDPEVRENLEKELLLSVWDRAQIILWIKRAGRYFPYIEEVLRRNGVPEDLKYVAVVESAMRPHAGSHKGAVGYWQFLSSTARKYGLTVNRYIDERRNIYTATEAAVRYFQELYATFGSWTLSAAAYNMGERRLEAEIKEQRVHNFYRLYLYEETQRYIFKILAAKQILADPARFGFHLSAEDLYAPRPVETVDLRLSRTVGVRSLARAARSDYKKIKDLNPQLRGRYLPKGRYTLLVPPDAARGFASRLQAVLQQEKNDGSQRVYVVRKGDNLSSIASRFNVSLPSLLRWNRLNASNPIHPGQRLVIYAD